MIAVVKRSLRATGHRSRWVAVSRRSLWSVRFGHAAALPVVSTGPVTDLPDGDLPAVLTLAEVAPGARMPVARMVQVIHLACPEVSARGATVIPSSTTGRNGNPATASGGTG